MQALFASYKFTSHATHHTASFHLLQEQQPRNIINGGISIGISIGIPYQLFYIYLLFLTHPFVHNIDK